MSMVMDVYELIRDLIEEAKEAQNANMVNQLIDIKLALLDIQEENKKLKKQLERQEQIERHPDCDYITLKDDGLHIQYCSTCWGNEGKLIQLRENREIGKGFPRCPICFNNWLSARNSGT